ncbi:hypothetical protein B0H19DRAFT_1119156 [Mycena capillaripes]|nr:hypothetical protein B0H19DRAFT_1119156 [Mycena capillaripes]
MPVLSLNLDDLHDKMRVDYASRSSSGPHDACTTLIPINLADLDMTISIKKFMKYEHRMSPDTLQLLTLSVRHPTRGEIGSITAVRVQHRCDGIFLEVMDVDTELFTIASNLFDKYGELRPWIIEHEYYKGSGVWGRELNQGRLVFIFCVSVDPPYRKQGIASWALQRLYASEHVERDDKMLCWPSPIPRPPPDEWLTTFDGIVDFFRKDPNHPSRNTDHLQDFDPDETYSIKGPHPRLSLQDAIFQDKTQKIIEVIHSMYTKDPSCIHLPDVNGFRPIFVAVKSDNLDALRALISLGLSDADFNSRANGDHLTPLEACNEDMRCSREFAEIFRRDGWQGHSDTSLYIKATLKRAMGHPMPGTDEEYVNKKRWGCTCNKCHSGWLSQQTLMRLQDEAEMGYDTAHETIDMEEMVSREPLDAQSIEYNPILSYIPTRLWPQVFKTFILGYGTIMKIIAQLLSRFILLTESTILAELVNGAMEYYDVQAAKFYFNKGGRVEYALAAIIDGAEAKFDMQGTALDMYRDDDRFLSTPACANDREYDIVRKNMGLDPQQPWGPYSRLPRHTDSTIDSDSAEEWDEQKDEEEDEEDDE